MSEDDELSDNMLAELAAWEAASDEALIGMDIPTAAIRDAKVRAKARKRELLPELAAQLDAALATIAVLDALAPQLRAAAETVAALADADTINGLSNHFLVDENDDAES